jgi:hypothetical protein
MRLIVFWGPKDKADLQTPEEVKWEDGTSASAEDYFKNQYATFSSYMTDRGLVSVYNPDCVAVTRYDHAKGHWVLYDGDRHMDLRETDPVATDENLITELATYEVFYNSTFDRSHLSTTEVIPSASAR